MTDVGDNAAAPHLLHNSLVIRVVTQEGETWILGPPHFEKIQTDISHFAGQCSHAIKQAAGHLLHFLLQRSAEVGPEGEQVTMCLAL